jgi:hypothetical protein
LRRLERPLQDPATGTISTPLELEIFHSGFARLG